MAKKQRLTPVEKMLAGKRRLVMKLKSDIEDIEADAAWQVRRIRSRIKIAQALIDALEKGTLDL